MRFAYYPGCVSKGSTPEADLATRWLAGKLDIELVELVDAGCCGSCEIKAVNPHLHLMLNARILALAEEKGLEILTICDTCQANLFESAHRVGTDPGARTIVIEKLGRAGTRYAKGARSRHLVKMLAEDIGLDALKRRVARPLTGLRVATFSCCHVFRGPGSDPANRPLIEQMVAVSGGSVQNLRDDGDCCGFHLLMVDEALSARAAGRFVRKCVEAGADCIATTSPLCHAALDIYQKKAQQSAGTASPIPVVHIEQLLGLSFGAGVAEIGLDRHMVSTSRFVDKIAA
jgi:succinate dehydrogenase / fumarate reductase cytochrome b subunit